MQDFRMQTFLEVCKDMNYTHAAERLHITQPAVTHQIHSLEEYYQVKLFTYERRKLTLTPEGEYLRDAALRLQNDEHYLAEQIRGIGRRRDLRFGATLSVAGTVIPEALMRLCRSDSGMRLHMVVHNTNTLLHLLDEGSINFAMVEGNFPEEQYASRNFSMEKFVPVGTPELAEKYRGCRTRDLRKETLLLREEGSGSREILESGFHHLHLSTRDFPCVHEIASIATIKRMVEAGSGVTFLYEKTALPEFAQGTLAPIELTDFAVQHPIRFIYRKDTIFEEDYRRIFDTMVKD